MNVKDIHDFLAGLSSGERAFLQLELIARNGYSSAGSRRIRPADLLRMERQLLSSIETAATPRIRNSRLRLWFIFMLLRYGGLRLEEIFSLRASDLDLARHRILIRHCGHPREVPLPPPVARLIREKLERWPAYIALPEPFRCDGSLVRRSFSQYSAQCEVPPCLCSARALRRHRARELEYAGLPQNLVNLFLGRLVNDPDFDAEQAWKILFQTISSEQFPRTSARNSFYGPLVSLIKRGILVETILESANGLMVKAIITDTSCQNLKLSLGTPVRALVKAPLVRVFAEGKVKDRSALNRFSGKITEIRRDEDAMEIMVMLPQGHMVCALYAFGEKPDLPLAEGDVVGVEFSPLSVILTGA